MLRDGVQFLLRFFNPIQLFLEGSEMVQRHPHLRKVDS